MLLLAWELIKAPARSVKTPTCSLDLSSASSQNHALGSGATPFKMAPIVKSGANTSQWALNTPQNGVQHSSINYHMHQVLLFTGGTRTCIHTPGASYLPENLTPNTMTQALDGAQLVYFDGRLTETAVLLARAARQQGVPVLVEAERLRPNLEVLLGEADYVCTSAHFPQVCHIHPHLGIL